MLLSVLYIVGITAEAVTAALSAGRQRMDLFGVMAIACMTSLGGGTVRDLLLDNYPLIWVETPMYLLIVVGAALVTVSLSFLMHYFRVLFLLLDAVGLSVFAVLGTQVALDQGHGLVIAIVAAVVTGVCGGMLRDIFSDRVPLVFSTEIYAMVAVIAACVYVGLNELGVDTTATIIVTLLVAFLIRVFAIYYKMGLPVFEYRGADQPIDPRVRLSYRLLRRGWRSARRRTGIDAVRYRLLNRRAAKRSGRDDSTWSMDTEMKKPPPAGESRPANFRIQKWPGKPTTEPDGDEGEGESK
ncbi:trimeric intracellular cation channel family protein [Corynebacterium halotolerans]|uniref:trimeric intracellular cation channel family protein n=1 Tax=Corynebacterium halotolerans TaxID=225326 RepID=UPI003CF09052